MSSHYAAVKAHTLAWSQRFGLPCLAPNVVDLVDLAALACRVYPAAGLAELCLASDWLCFLFPGEEAFASGGPLSQAWVDLSRRAGAGMSSAWHARFEQHNAVSGAARRVYRLSMLPAFDLIEVVQQTEIPPEIYATDRIQGILRAGNAILSRVRDVYAAQQNGIGEDTGSLLLSVCREQQCSLPEALDYVCALITAEMKRFAGMLRHLPASSLDCNRYAGPLWIGVADWLRGYLDWQRGHARFLHAARAFADAPDFA